MSEPLTENDPTAWLEYLVSGPAPEDGGFHPNIVKTAELAIAEIRRLRAAIPLARWAALEQAACECERLGGHHWTPLQIANGIRKLKDK